MSISAAINNAVSGLNFASRSAEVVSTNLSNATDESYARREIDASARATGGISAAGGAVRRVQDHGLLADMRLAEAARGAATSRLEGLERIERALGAADGTGGLTDRIAEFESALVRAATRPDSEPRLAAVRDAGVALAAEFNAAASEVQALRKDADKALANAVERINDNLHRVDRLNDSITVAKSRGRDASALLDERQRAVDDIAALVPVREIPRDGDRIALLTAGGATLIDSGPPAEFTFARSNDVTAKMTREGGALSGLEIDGKAVDPGSDGSLAGGALSAHFAMRDELGPQAQSRLDGTARDLLARVEAPEADPTRALDDPALFTDDGAPLDPDAETGLASRLGFNANADPAAGGDLWRLRAGLGADAPGPVGDASRLMALSDALEADRVPESGAITSSARDFAELTADMVSLAGTARQSAEVEKSYADAEAGALHEARLADGVDSDAELQRLLQIERVYAANARVLTTADNMIRTILEI